MTDVDTPSAVHGTDAVTSSLAPAAAPPLPPTDGQITEAIDKVITMAFKMEAEIKENADDEKQPGQLGRMAANRAPRLRRKSKDLQENFNTLMGPVLEQVFKHFDTDNSGNLDSSELKAAFEAAGRPADEETIASAIKALDTDGDGEISLEEFKVIAWRVSLG